MLRAGLRRHPKSAVQHLFGQHLTRHSVPSQAQRSWKVSCQRHLAPKHIFRPGGFAPGNQRWGPFCRTLLTFLLFISLAQFYPFHYISYSVLSLKISYNSYPLLVFGPLLIHFSIGSWPWSSCWASDQDHPPSPHTVACRMEALRDTL